MKGLVSKKALNLFSGEVKDKNLVLNKLIRIKLHKKITKLTYPVLTLCHLF